MCPEQGLVHEENKSGLKCPNCGKNTLNESHKIWKGTSDEGDLNEWIEYCSCGYSSRSSSHIANG